MIFLRFLFRYINKKCAILNLLFDIHQNKILYPLFHSILFLFLLFFFELLCELFLLELLNVFLIFLLNLLQSLFLFFFVLHFLRRCCTSSFFIRIIFFFYFLQFGHLRLREDIRTNIFILLFQLTCFLLEFQLYLFFFLFFLFLLSLQLF
jgi:hypothetical protein